jgi:hypothetical protein
MSNHDRKEPRATDADVALDRAWRQASDERPPDHLDAAIVEAARAAVEVAAPRPAVVVPRSAPRFGAFVTRWQPVAAAAAVAGLAFVLVQTLPRGPSVAPAIRAVETEPTTSAPEVPPPASMAPNSSPATAPAAAEATAQGPDMAEAPVATSRAVPAPAQASADVPAPVDTSEEIPAPGTAPGIIEPQAAGTNVMRQEASEAARPTPSPAGQDASAATAAPPAAGFRG